MLLTESQMLAIWRRVLGLDCSMPDAAADRTDGIDIDAYLRRAMRTWYLDHLDNAPLASLVISDVADVAATRLTPSGNTPATGTIAIPDTWRRICSVKLHGWLRPAVPVDAADPAAGPLLARMCAPLAAPGVFEPVAVRTPAAIICAPFIRPGVESLLAVADPGPGLYEMHESLLSTIPQTIDFSAL